MTVPIPQLDHDGEIASAIRKLREATLTLVAQKLANPLDEIQPDEEYRAASLSYDITKSTLQSYNNYVDSTNENISLRKHTAQFSNIKIVENDLNKLRMIKVRSEDVAEQRCVEYKRLISEKRELDNAKKLAKEFLDKHADNMITEYEKTINTLLRGFGAGFSMTNSKKNYTGGTATSTYQILINNYPVELGDDNTPIGRPCFRTTLSAGDKSTLALAFFLAQLDHDPNKEDKIVIFDDPFNSQDRSRRERTAELLKKYGKECQQLFLFSHDPFFLNLVFSKLPSAERRSLQLSRAADNNTTIEEWDVERETQEGYFREHAALASYLLNGAKALSDIARKDDRYLKATSATAFQTNSQTMNG